MKVLKIVFLKNGNQNKNWTLYIEGCSYVRLSIEHIKAKALQFDKDFVDNYLHNIGNLVIDCKASNSSKGNRNTEDKMDAYQTAPLMS